MNDDTVPDVGMTIGFDGGMSPSHSCGKSMLPAFALASFCARAEVDLISGIVTWLRSMCKQNCTAAGRSRIAVCLAG